MGAVASRHVFLQEHPDYESYVQSTFRSDRARELDELGLGRPPIALGNSFDAKMSFLGEQLQEKGEKLKEILAPAKGQQQEGGRQLQQQQSRNKSNYYLNTDRRAAARKGDVLPPNDNLDAWASSKPASGRFMSQAEYLKMRRAAVNGMKRQQAAAAVKAPPAEWRKRVHAARRRAFIMVMTMIRVKRGLHHPKRFLRFSDLSFLIPKLLGEDWGRFTAEQQKYASTRRAIATARAELDELLRAAAAEVLPASGGSNNSSGLRSALRTPAGKDGPGNTAAGVGGTVKGGTGQLQQQQRDSSTSRDQAVTEGPPTPPPASPLRGKSSGPQEAVHNGSHSPMRYNTRYGGGNSSTTAGAGGATIPTTQLPPRSSGSMRRVTFDGDTEALSSPAAAVKPMLQGSSEVPSNPIGSPSRYTTGGMGAGTATSTTQQYPVNDAPEGPRALRKFNSSSAAAGPGSSPQRGAVGGQAEGLNNRRLSGGAGSNGGAAGARNLGRSRSADRSGRRAGAVAAAAARAAAAVEGGGGGRARAGAGSPVPGSCASADGDRLSLPAVGATARRNAAPRLPANARRTQLTPEPSNRSAQSADEDTVGPLPGEITLSAGGGTGTADCTALARSGSTQGTDSSTVLGVVPRQHSMPVMGRSGPNSRGRVSTAAGESEGHTTQSNPQLPDAAVQGGVLLPDISPGRRSPGSSTGQLAGSTTTQGGSPTRYNRGLQQGSTLQASSAQQGQGHSTTSVGGGNIEKLPSLGRNQQQGGDAPGVDRHTRMTQLRDELDALFDSLKRSTKLLGMFVNRVNGTWAEAQQWGAPQVTSATEVGAWMKGDQFNIYKADVLRLLRQGQIAVQIMADEDSLSIPSQPSTLSGGGAAEGRGVTPSYGGHGHSSASHPQQQDLWTSDPWDLVDSCRPGIMPATDRIEGLSLGGRVLCQLALVVQALAGKEALDKLHVVLAVSEEQEEEVVEELHERNCYGLNRENVIVVIAGRHLGYRYHASEGTFMSENPIAGAAAAAGSHLVASVTGQAPGMVPLGSGHVLCQMAWAGEAFTVGEDGLQRPLPVPLIERLEARKIDWMVSRRVRDLALLSREGVLDVPSLAYGMYMRDRLRAHAVLEVAHTTSAVVARQHDAIILQHASKMGGDPRMVAELRQSDLVAPKVIDAVESQRTLPGTKGLAVGLHRYLVHLPTVKGLLSSLAVFRPRLSLSRELLHVTLDMTDILAHDKCRTMAMEARHFPGLLSSPASLDSLVPLLQAQDHDPAFRDIVLTMGPNLAAGGGPGGDGGSSGQQQQEEATVEGPSIVSGNKGQTKSGQPVVVFIAKNSVSAIAVQVAANLARAGRDLIQLVTFVPTEAQRADGEQLLAGHKRAAMRAMTDVRTDVVVRGTSGLLEVMERYMSQAMVSAGSRPVVVMGSAQLTSNVFTYVVGSVTLSAIRRLAGTPVVVVTANTKQIPPRPGMKTIALVEGHSRSMLNYLCTSLVEQPRGDRLLLAQVQPSSLITRQQAATYKRLLDASHTLCFSHQQPVYKALSGEGPLDRVMCELVEENGAGLVALQLPPGTKSLPQQLMQLMRSNRGATLIYTDSAVRQSMLRKSGALRRSMNMLAQIRAARTALQASEAAQAAAGGH